MRGVACEPGEVVETLLPVLGRKANPGGRPLSEALDGQCFKVLDGAGKIVAAYVLRGQGGEVWIQAAAGRADIDLSDVIDDLIAKHGAGFESIAFRTDRVGCVKKALRRGYRIVSTENGFTMRKKLK